MSTRHISAAQNQERIALLQAKGWIDAEWGASQTNRRARFDQRTKSGRKELAGRRGSGGASPQRSAGFWGPPKRSRWSLR